MPRFKSSNPEHQVYEDWKTLHASGEETATGTSTLEEELPDGCKAILFMLDVTAAALLVGDSLDVYVQTWIDSAVGPAWVDMVHFAQCLGNGGALRHIEKEACALAEAGFLEGAALGVGTVRNIRGSAWRCRWVMAGGGAEAFTFEVTAQPM